MQQSYQYMKFERADSTIEARAIESWVIQMCFDVWKRRVAPKGILYRLTDSIVVGGFET